jgi:hypothetical protein
MRICSGAKTQGHGTDPAPRRILGLGAEFDSNNTADAQLTDCEHLQGRDARERAQVKVTETATGKWSDASL